MQHMIENCNEESKKVGRRGYNNKFIMQYSNQIGSLRILYRPSRCFDTPDYNANNGHGGNVTINNYIRKLGFNHSTKVARRRVW